MAGALRPSRQCRLVNQKKEMKWTGVQSCYWPVHSGCGQGVGSSAPTLQAILLLVDCSRPFVHLFGTSVVVVPFFFFRFDFECGLCKKNHIRMHIFCIFTQVSDTTGTPNAQTYADACTLRDVECKSLPSICWQKPISIPSKVLERYPRKHGSQNNEIQRIILQRLSQYLTFNLVATCLPSTIS